MHKQPSTAVTSDVRNLWVDYAKGVGIILVVYGHVARGIVNAKIPVDQFIFATIDSIIYSFHMPLFFFLSGLFFYDSFAKRTWVGFVAGKIDSIVYPYILWSILQGLLEVVLGHFTNGKVTLQEVFSLLWAPRAQFWFLYALFQVFLLASVVYFKRDKRYFLGVSLLASVGYLSAPEIAGFTRFALTLPHFCFFSLGVLYKEHVGYFHRNRFKLILPLLVMAIAGHWYYQLLLSENQASNIREVNLLVAVVSILFVATFCQCISSARIPVLSMLGARSMPIYLAHVLAAAGTRILLQKFMGIQDALLHLGLGVIAGLTIPVLLDVYGKKMGFGFLFSIPAAFSAERAHKNHLVHKAMSKTSG